MNDNLLFQSIKKALLNLEERGDIVLCASDTNIPAKRIYETVSELVPNERLTTAELSGLRALILQAVSDDRFFDWEMPTLTGLTSDQFKEVARKLPKG
ncbi:hypothetical protein FMN50_17980 [Rhodobacterales bacterium]|nr:hypothetical protein FMN50_17980 [Rhodobacterales bacterium]